MIVNGTSTGTLIASPNTITFGSVPIGQTVNTTVSLMNNGPKSVQIEQINLSGERFSLDGLNSLPVTLTAGATYTLNVRFSPAVIGTATGQLRITSGSSYISAPVINLIGTGVATPVISVALTPATASTSLGATQQFAASVTGTSDTSVAWTVSGSGCKGAGCGTISSNGLYAAPTTLPSPATVLISAASVIDRDAFATAVDTVFDPSTVDAPNLWLAGVPAAAASYGCRDISVQQRTTESLTEVIRRFDLTASEGSCLVLWPISTTPDLLRYSLVWGGQVNGKNIRYISDVGQMRIWNGVDAAFN